MSQRRPPGSLDSAVWDGFAAEWVGTHRQRLWRRHSDAVNAALLEAWLPVESAGRILKTDLFDEAVSEGVYPALASRWHQTVGVDVSAAVVGAAVRKYSQLCALAGDVRCLPLRPNSCDAIVSLSTLDHFESADDIPAALAELFRVLRPGGVLVLTLDNLANPVIRIRNTLPFGLTHGIGLLPYPVGLTHGPRQAGILVKNAGFELVEMTAVMHAPRVVAIPLMAAFGGNASGAADRLILRAAMQFEGLRRLWSRFRTGHFIAIRAAKPIA